MKRRSGGKHQMRMSVRVDVDRLTNRYVTWREDSWVVVPSDVRDHLLLWDADDSYEYGGPFRFLMHVDDMVREILRGRMLLDEGEETWSLEGEEAVYE